MSVILFVDGRVEDVAQAGWRLLEAGVSLPDGPHAPQPHPLLVPLDRWLALPVADREGLGVWLSPAEEPSALAGKLGDRVPVAVSFPTFKDGRGYSTATLLRTRLHFGGDLRAVGDVLIDQLFYLKRVGFTSFALRADQRVADAVAALASFDETYQGAADGRLPLFRRRGAGGARRPGGAVAAGGAR